MSTGSGILAISKGLICLPWRSPVVRQGNRWGVIGGMLHEGMDVMASALVEMEEEVGYKGPIELAPAIVDTLKGFTYHTFIGIVPEPFPFDPRPEYAWETSFISWMTLQRITELMSSSPETFHFGVLRLFTTQRQAIERFL